MEKHEIWPTETGIVGLSQQADVFVRTRIHAMREVWRARREALEAEGLPAVSAFMEKLGREWSIETGVIEGVYNIDRGVTQTLVEEGFQSSLLDRSSTNKSPDFVLRVLQDQKDALDGLFAFVKQERELTVSYIKELHAAMLRSQTHCEAFDPIDGRVVEVELIKGAFKQHENYPQRDGKVFTYCPPVQTAAEMDRLVQLDAEHEELGFPVEVRAAWLHHRFTQIHPFQDGNGRVARALASLLFIREGLFPLVLNRNEKGEYLAALERADAGDLRELVSLFARLLEQQATAAISSTESALRARRGVKDSLARLRATVDVLTAPTDANGGESEPWARARRSMMVTALRLEDVGQELRDVLSVYDPNASYEVERSDASNTKKFDQLIAEANERSTGAYELPSGHLEWCALSVVWSGRMARLVFYVASRKIWDGSVEVACAALLEFLTKADCDWKRHTLDDQLHSVPFPFNGEQRSPESPKFAEWLDQKISAMIASLQAEF